MRRILMMPLSMFNWPSSPGYVFNLQTKSGFYVANGIYTHNCRCSIQMVTDLDQLDNQEAA